MALGSEGKKLSKESYVRLHQPTLSLNIFPAVTWLVSSLVASIVAHHNGNDSTHAYATAFRTTFIDLNTIHASLFSCLGVV